MKNEKGKLKNKQRYIRSFSAHISHISILRGFTLIEFLAVFAILAIIGTVSLASFSSYTNTQTFQTSTADVMSLLNVARSRALTYVKPVDCVSELQGYQVVFAPSDSSYTLEVVCGATPNTIETKSLGQGVSISEGSLQTVFFAVGTGTAAPGNVRLSGYGKEATITIDTTGTISVQ